MPPSPAQAAANAYSQIAINNSSAHLGDIHQYIRIVRDGHSEGDRRLAQCLASLRYPEMNARRNEINDTKYDTFEWVFRDDQDQSDPSSLVHWLAEGSGIFVVNGKPGSGKSTFMKFVFEHPKTLPLLASSQPSPQQQQPALLLFHSFWHLGSKIQHSFKGFLSLILHQTINKFPASFTSCTEVGWTSKHYLDDWSVKELKTVLLHVLDAVPVTTCLFLDAVDEFDQDDDVDLLLDFVEAMCFQVHKLKICLSTRPQRHIWARLEKKPGITLQDLTGNDIEDFVSQSLQNEVNAGSTSEWLVEKIISTICERADGVFLWVYYVVKNVCVGLKDDEELTALLQVIEALPREMEQLYSQMWYRHNAQSKSHAKEEAAMMFALSRRFPMSVFQFAIALDPSLAESYLHGTWVLDDTKIDNLVDRTRRRIAIRTAGLLECIQVDPEDPVEETLLTRDRSTVERGSRLRGHVVKLIHKSAEAFLAETQCGIEMCSAMDEAVDRRCDRFWLSSSFAGLIENVILFTEGSVLGISLSYAWRSLGRDLGPFLDAWDRIGNKLVAEGLRDGIPHVKTCRRSNWIIRSQESPIQFTEFKHLMAASSSKCVKHFLSAGGIRECSSYYKSHLGMGYLTTRNNDDTISETLQMVALLKASGADLTALHPYGSGYSYLAIRSVASHILDVICRHLLNATVDRSMGEHVRRLLDILEDYEYHEQDLTFFWDLVDKKWRSYESFLESAVILTYPVSCVHNALRAMIGEYPGHLQPTIRSINRDELATQQMRSALVRLFRSMPHKTHICDISRSLDATFHLCSSVEAVSAEEVVFDGSESFGWGSESDQFTLDGLNVSDLDPTRDWEQLAAFLQPLDPYEPIHGNEWKSKGVLRACYDARSDWFEVPDDDRSSNNR